MDGLKKKQDAREQSSSLEREHHKTTWTWIGKTTKTGNKPDREENAKHLDTRQYGSSQDRVHHKTA